MRESARSRIAAVLGARLPLSLDAIADAVERLVANGAARERVHRRTVDALRAAERERDDLRAVLARRDGGGR